MTILWRHSRLSCVIVFSITVRKIWKKLVQFHHYIQLAYCTPDTKKFPESPSWFKLLLFIFKAQYYYILANIRFPRSIIMTTFSCTIELLIEVLSGCSNGYSNIDHYKTLTTFQKLRLSEIRWNPVTPRNSSRPYSTDWTNNLHRKNFCNNYVRCV